MEQMGLDTWPIYTSDLQYASVSIVFGSDHYWNNVTGNVKSIIRKTMAMETQLGCTVRGPLPCSAYGTHCFSVTVLRASTEPEETSRALTLLSELKSIELKEDCPSAQYQDLLLAAFERDILKEEGR